jgi:hypothetical protein
MNVGARDRVATDADTRGLRRCPAELQLVEGLVGERARAADDADWATAGLAISPAVMPMLHLPGLMMPGQLGPSRRACGKSRLSSVEEPGLVLRRHALGDDHDELDAGLGGLHHCASRTPGAGMKMHDAFAPVAAHGVADRREDGDALDVRRRPSSG